MFQPPDKCKGCIGKKYHGLYNQGATCYLNSVLQVLFMTRDFREAVESNRCDDQSLDKHLKTLFDELKNHPVETKNITKKLGITRVDEQRDAAECFEDILRNVTTPGASQLFQGQLTHKRKCFTCGTETSSDDPFWSLPLQLVGSYGDYKVVDGVAEYFSESHVSRPNQLFCDHCAAKTDATVKSEVKHHPEMLMLQLKRFKFNETSRRFVKITRCVEFPYMLEIPHTGAETQIYELYAFVEHIGLIYGHYTVTIKSQDDGKWYKFNETTVTSVYHQPFEVGITHRSWDAYLLFYRKAAAAETSSTSGAFKKDTRDNNKQHVHDVKRTEKREVEGAAAGSQYKMDRRESEEKRRVDVRGDQGGGNSSVKQRDEKIMTGQKRTGAEKPEESNLSNNQTLRSGAEGEGAAKTVTQGSSARFTSTASKNITGYSNEQHDHNVKTTDRNNGERAAAGNQDDVGRGKTEGTRGMNVREAQNRETRDEKQRDEEKMKTDQSTTRAQMQRKSELSNDQRGSSGGDGVAASDTLTPNITAGSSSEASKFNTRDNNEQHVHDVKAGRETAKVSSKHGAGASSLDSRKTPQYDQYSGKIYILLAQFVIHLLKTALQLTCITDTYFHQGKKYHGLYNQGATSYLNSVLQVLFMTRDFREAVESNRCDDQSLDKHLKTLFEDLKNHPVETKNITKKLGITRVDEQRDAAECFENILRNLTTPGASQLFQGQLTHKSKCSACGTETSSDDPFWSLPLQLLESYKDYKVVDGVADFFREADVSGPNQLFCDSCDAKADATLKSEITHHPEVLMLMLKRFKFDYRYMNYVKMNQIVVTPYKLQIPPSGAQSQIYELYAFVEHVGELKYGHYTVTIRSQDDGKWYHFNDSEVRLLSFQPFLVDITERSWDAYLLFYRKVAAADTSSTSGAFKKDTRDNNKQHVHDVKTTEKREVEGAAAGSQYKMDRRESEEKRRVDVRGDQGGGNSSVKQRDEKIMTGQKRTGAEIPEESNLSNNQTLRSGGEGEGAAKTVTQGSSARFTSTASKNITGYSNEQHDHNVKTTDRNNGERAAAGNQDDVGRGKTEGTRGMNVREAQNRETRDEKQRDEEKMKTDQSTTRAQMQRKSELSNDQRGSSGGDGVAASDTLTPNITAGSSSEASKFNTRDNNEQHVHDVKAGRETAKVSSKHGAGASSLDSRKTPQYDQYSGKKYHGLYNQGATSYLNSVLQVLFMTRDFREAVESNRCDDQSLDKHLKTLFEDLKNHPVETKNITKKLGITRVDEQRDAAECFENILRNVTTPEASQLFQGQLTHKSKCSACGTETSSDDPFWSLPLELVESYKDYKVVDGVADFFREADVSGPNQLFCDSCDAKADAILKSEITHHPEVLMLMLKRFKFDYRYMNYVKMNQIVVTPYKLQIPPSGAQSQIYELYAFVEHVGELKYGNYTVTIRSQDDGKWYHFNDSEVRLLSFQPFLVDITERSWDAYLLFYRKAAAAETSSTSGAFKKDTRDNNKQHVHDVKRTEKREVEGAAAGSQYKMDRRESEEKRRVDVRGDQGGGNSSVKQRDEKIMTGQKRTGAEIPEESNLSNNQTLRSGGEGEGAAKTVTQGSSARFTSTASKNITGYSNEQHDHNVKTTDRNNGERAAAGNQDDVGRGKTEGTRGMNVREAQNRETRDEKQRDEEKMKTDQSTTRAQMQRKSELSNDQRGSSGGDGVAASDTLTPNITAGSSSEASKFNTRDNNEQHVHDVKAGRETAKVSSKHGAGASSLDSRKTSQYDQYSGKKYHGLYNQGATSYLNSVLQVLFMTRDFREAVESNRCDDQSLDKHLKTLFEDLKNHPVETKNITKKLGITRVDEQRDAAECFENILRNVTTPEASQLFQGQLTHKSKCSACGTETSSDDPFWSLPLELVESYKDYKVVDGVADFFREADVSGPNQLFCDSCDAKADAILKSEITHHPEVLMLMLKRFKFDYRYMNYVKMNQIVVTPYKLQIPPSGAQSQIYELYAFVEHVGELKYGNYTVTIRSQDDGKWYHFNDSEVRLLSFQPFLVDITERSWDAYLLFYRKAAAAETSSTSGAFKKDTRDNNKQHVHDVKRTEKREVEGAAAGSQYKMDRRESEEKRRVDVRGDQGGGNSSVKQRDEKIMTGQKRTGAEIPEESNLSNNQTLRSGGEGEGAAKTVTQGSSARFTSTASKNITGYSNEQHDHNVKTTDRNNGERAAAGNQDDVGRGKTEGTRGMNVREAQNRETRDEKQRDEEKMKTDQSTTRAQMQRKSELSNDQRGSSGGDGVAASDTLTPNITAGSSSEASKFNTRDNNEQHVHDVKAGRETAKVSSKHGAGASSLDSRKTSQYDQYSGKKYHGLYNQGATSYLNSVLQVLFMTRDFREAVESNRCDDQSLDKHLKTLFEDLKNHPVETKNITKKLGITRVDEQRDAAECFENILRNVTTPEASQLFQGQLTHKSKCSACGTETSSDDPFWSLPLELVGSYKDYKVVDGVADFFREADVSGPNQLFCDSCDAKADAILKSEITHHPEVLMLMLKRFKFDYRYMNYVKMNQIVVTPYKLQIPPSGAQSQIYELYAFVEHVGELKYGNYTVTIRSQDDGKWYHFNDSEVRLLSFQPFLVDITERSWDAYLLFYRKVAAAETSSTSGAFKKDTRDNNKQHVHDVKRTEKREVEGAAAGSQYKMDRLETEDKRKVDVRGDQGGGNSSVKQRDEKIMTGQKRTGAEIPEESNLSNNQTLRSGAEGEGAAKTVTQGSSARFTSTASKNITGYSNEQHDHNVKTTDRNNGERAAAGNQDDVGRGKTEGTRGMNVREAQNRETRDEKQRDEEKMKTDQSTTRAQMQRKSELSNDQRGSSGGDGVAASDTLTPNITAGSSSEASKFNTRDNNEQHVHDVKAGRETAKVSSKHGAGASSLDSRKTSQYDHFSGKKYHGLYNQGATSYLNSVLQVLFMTRDFREAVESNRCDDRSLDKHLKTLFEDLKNHPVETKNITKKLGITRVDEQRDAAECFENILRNVTTPEASQLFQGQLTHKSKCSACGTETSSDDPFWSLPLELVGSYGDYKVVDGVADFFREADVSGPNQLFCDSCDAKADAILKSEITHHPEVLMLMLKRFKFDYRYMNYVKMNQIVVTPYKLQIPPSGAQSQIYELYAFVEHVGELKYGNYTVTIRSQDDGKWYHFNDSEVRLLSFQPFLVDITERSWDAYLLFYRKVAAADTSSTSGAFKKDTRDNNKQHVHDVKRTEKREVEGAAAGSQYKMDRRESEEKRRVDVRGDQGGGNSSVKQRDEKIMTGQKRTGAEIPEESNLSNNQTLRSGGEGEGAAKTVTQGSSARFTSTASKNITGHSNEQHDHNVKTTDRNNGERAAAGNQDDVGRGKTEGTRGMNVREAQNRETRDEKQRDEEKMKTDQSTTRAQMQRKSELSNDQRGSSGGDGVAASDTLTPNITAGSSSEASKFNTRDNNEQHVHDVKAGRETAKVSSKHGAGASSLDSRKTSQYDQYSGKKYHGLYNQGATSYLNSVLQVLFMTRDFREAVESNRCDDQSLDKHLKTLFEDLKNHPVETKNITKKLGITRVDEQRDAAECFENILRNVTTPEASQLFQGQLTHKRKCFTCGTETSSDDPFWSLPLELVGSYKDYKVVDGVADFFREADVSGPNQLFCDSCDAKADAILKSEITHHPEVLMLMLKRFKFDYRYMNYVKMNQIVVTPYKLQIPPSGAQSQIYELYAFVEHVGELKYGNYTVTIRSQDDGKWYHFNDSEVRLLSFQPFLVDITERSWDAYLLFYRKAAAAETSSTSGAFKKDTRDNNKQHVHDVKRTEKREVEGAAA
ncbi:uncharacterized protein [Leuresthes tenuis]|uniref:uncharacterized protein n=1 Tax=Leuresthes tenuis TaxID=355514 RepID=UPI003B4FFA7C